MIVHSYHSSFPFISLLYHLLNGNVFNLSLLYHLFKSIPQLSNFSLSVCPWDRSDGSSRALGAAGSGSLFFGEAASISVEW